MIVWASQAQPAAPSAKPRMEMIRVSPDGRRFVLLESGAEFRPWGFNYDHDASNRLLETYWQAEWSTVMDDFAEMKELGANTVRVYHCPPRWFLDELARPASCSVRTGARGALAASTDGSDNSRCWVPGISRNAHCPPAS